MAVLHNQRHEKFAQALAKGMTAADAYAGAGYAPNRGNAAALNRLLKKSGETAVRL